MRCIFYNRPPPPPPLPFPMEFCPTKPGLPLDAFVNWRFGDGFTVIPVALFPRDLRGQPIDFDHTRAALGLFLNSIAPERLRLFLHRTVVNRDGVPVGDQADLIRPLTFQRQLCTHLANPHTTYLMVQRTGSVIPVRGGVATAQRIASRSAGGRRASGHGPSLRRRRRRTAQCVATTHLGSRCSRQESCPRDHLCAQHVNALRLHFAKQGFVELGGRRVKRTLRARPQRPEPRG